MTAHKQISFHPSRLGFPLFHPGRLPSAVVFTFHPVPPRPPAAALQPISSRAMQDEWKQMNEHVFVFRKCDWDEIVFI